jgi:hypothetical protein
VRAVAAVSAAALPLVVSTVTPLVDHGAAVQAATTRAAPALKIIDAHPGLFTRLSRYPPGHAPAALQARAVTEVGVPAQRTVQRAGPALSELRRYGPSVRSASARNPAEWQTWWWVCLGGQVVFVPFIFFVMAGRWRPRRAARDLAEHNEQVARHLASMRASS